MSFFSSQEAPFLCDPSTTFMSSVEQQINTIRAAVGNSDPWVSGTIQVPPDSLDLYYLDKSGVPQILKLTPGAAVDDLNKLSTYCDRATFGRAKEELLDESYRKAGKMDVERFASKLDSNVIRLLPGILPQLLRGEDVDRKVDAELYKLNVYDAGSFFRVHKDTPRGKYMFGSLVIVFPTLHTGGQLVLRHGEKEHNFDSGTILSNSPSPNDTIAYVAFFSDVEHEVLPVISGHRITLTYNLYFSKSSNQGPDSLLVTKTNLKLRDAISAILDNPQFLPNGGLLGFALSHSYAVDTQSSESLNEILRVLKGEDAVIRSACEDLGLDLSINCVIKNRLLLNHAIDLSDYGEIEGSLLNVVMRHERGTLTHRYNGKPFWEYGQRGKYSKAIAWIKHLGESQAGYKSSYIAYGNQASLAFEYIHLTLVAAFGPVGDRKNWSAYKGEERV
ncbi:hypothetical protein E1B28_000046 [Marasmius oreades]|uniref:Prolyl 4-hydroxylase alpha subunit Fe(2+) 2OG dioxygenase domain-containing protein n=1 Tax=Marasmius oreades TaxID=181124 RepID=A0A9P7V0M3_9AGAR|nr:uncharacterized protein E1B28_000046 [Marasmius oreades]KAG7098072.1 hypothetical protein E1B28_000046 [Marasmius oreades]